MHPPGENAAQSKVDHFLESVSKQLAGQESLELLAKGEQAVLHAVKALALGDRTSEFQIVWLESGDPTTKGDRDRSLSFIARGGDPWDVYLKSRLLDTKAIAIDQSSKVQQEARKLVKLLVVAENGPSVRLHAPIHDAAAVNIMAKVIATALPISPFSRILCVANIVKSQVSESSQKIPAKVYINVRPPEGEKPKRSGTEFRALPPGNNADSGTVDRFVIAVRDRLHRGDSVVMECRGADALCNTLRALCTLPGHTANMSVEWSGRDTAVALKVKAEMGPTWKEFNATDFTTTNLVTVKETSPVKDLAWTIEKEVRQNDAVAVHCFSDIKDAVNVAMKALATVPRLASRGDAVSCIPSHGRVGPRPVLRLWVTRAPKRSSLGAAEQPPQKGDE